ncbi:rhomboid-domain-containing protein [Poronia punctata]|nr:rhomboid-domain-containing protein [Poronia punctata]
MPLLPLMPLSSLSIGLRTVVRASEKCAASVTVPITRTFSTSGAPCIASPTPYARSCFQYNARGFARPSLGPRHATRHATAINQWQTRTIFMFRAITHYTELPDSYRDADGLPFRREDLNQREANQIFPSNIPAADANRLLRILHGRRIAGTLDDPILMRNTRQFRISDQKRALEYLREHIPVDEVLNAGLRAEDELLALEVEDADALPESDRLPRRRESDSPYGVSNFDRIRAENIAKREAEEARLEEERRIREEEMAKGNIGGLQNEMAKPRELSEYRKKYMERAQSDLKAPPEMSAWQRLFPTVATAGLIMLGSVVLSLLYQPPSTSQRLFPDIPPAAATCISLIVANVAVWALWKYPPAWTILNKYMIVIAATPRPLQLIGALFSHQSMSHLAANMVWLWFFGTRIHDEIGRGNFLGLYFSAGALGYVASLTHAVLWRGLHITTLGASGSVYALIAAFFWMHRFDEFKILGFPPDPISGPQGLGFLGLIIGMHILAIWRKRTNDIDMASHFAGMLAGMIGIDVIRSQMERRARMRAERLKSMGVLDKVVETKQISPAVVKVDAPSSNNR